MYCESIEDGFVYGSELCEPCANYEECSSADHSNKLDELDTLANKLGIDIEDIVWLVSCDDVKQMKRYLFVFGLFPCCIRKRLVKFMSKHELRIPYFGA